MKNLNKYMLGAVLGAVTVGIAVVAATKFVPKMKDRMENHCRGMLTGFVEAGRNQTPKEDALR